MFELIAVVLLICISLVVCISIYSEIYTNLNAEYLRRKEAKEKYNRDPETYGVLVNEEDFYYPTITYGNILWSILLFGLPILNLITIGYLVVKWICKEAVLLCKSSVFPW